MKNIWIIAFLVGLAACSSKENKGNLPGFDTVRINLDIHRADSSLMACASKDAVKAWLAQNAQLRNLYFPEQTFGPTDTLAAALYQRISNADFKAFYAQSNKLFDFEGLKNQLETGFKNLKCYDVTHKTPKIVLCFTGFLGGDLALSDSVIVIGWDYFLGKKSPFQPEVYDYQRWKYSPEALVPQLFAVLSVPYCARDNQQTLLADMLDYGKGFAFAEAMLPNTPDSLMIGYSQEQLDETAIAQDLVWGYFIDNKLLYEVNPNKKSKFVGERPTTPEIGPRCPGWIGRWVGWQITRFYQKNNPEASLEALLGEEDARIILEASKYRGEGE